MSILKVNEVQVFNGNTITLTATTTAASGAVTVGGNLTVSGAISSSDASTTRTNLGLGTIATQAADSVNIDGGAIDAVTIGTNSAVTDLRVDNLKLDATRSAAQTPMATSPLTRTGQAMLLLETSLLMQIKP